VGTLLGVAAGFLLTEALSSFLGGGDFGSTLVQSFTVTDGNLVTAFSVGFLLTLGTILVTVAYVSRLNIVRAVRGLPEPTLRRGHYYRLAILGAALLGIALLLVAAGLPPAVPSTTALLGISLAFAGLARIASAWVRNRVAFSALGLAWVAFWAYLPAQTALVGPSHPTSLDVVFVAGIFSILGALLLYVFNADLIARGIARLLRSRPQRVPVGQLAFSYPTQRRLRTSMTLSIFALVIFVVVAVASIGAGLQGNLNGIARSQSGGFTMFGTAQTPIPDLPGDIQNNTTLAAEFSVAVPFYSTAGTLQYPGAPPNFTYRLAAAPTQVPSWENFYDQSQLNFTSTLHGMSAATVLQELQTNRSVAVVDGTFASAGAINFGASHPPLRVGEPITVEVAGTPVQVTVIGILAEVFVQVVFLNPQTLAVTLHQPYFLSFALTVKSGVNAQTALDDLKRAFFPFGLQLIDFANALAQGLQTTFAIFDLLEVFVALGLMVGIVAIGITSLRAVVERRNQIGIARALGLRQRQVLSAFLLEYGFLALVGILIGTTMGLLVAYHAAEGGGAGFLVFVVPWSNLLTVILPAFALTLLATGIPALKASRLPPADAIRYSE
jgi:putative ABC transport system permease protein